MSDAAIMLRYFLADGQFGRALEIVADVMRLGATTPPLGAVAELCCYASWYSV